MIAEKKLVNCENFQKVYAIYAPRDRYLGNRKRLRRLILEIFRLVYTNITITYTTLSLNRVITHS